MAKYQNGGRFPQRMFDEGRMEDIQMIFNEIIGYVVELMMVIQEPKAACQNIIKYSRAAMQF